MYRFAILVLIGLCNFIVPLQAQNEAGPTIPDNGRILIVSGGGATGAWGGGVTQALHKQGLRYDAVIGSSTGSLIAPFILNESFDELKEGYTNITDKDIFNVRPFKTKGKKKGELRMFNALWRIISPKKTLGESKNLLKTIRKFFTQTDFDSLRNTECDFFVTVVNVLEDEVEYKSIHDPELGMVNGVYDSVEAYKSYTRWIWASANFPVFMSMHSVRDEAGVRSYYFDGGIKESIPLEKGLALAREKGYRNIDVIIHSTGDPQLTHDSQVNKAMKLLGRTIEIFRSEVRQNDVKLVEAIGKLEARPKKEDAIDVTIYYMAPEDYNRIPNQLIFDKTEMTELWEIGTQIFNLNRYEGKIVEFSIDNDQALNDLLGNR
ncbi:MAG: patatin-like phospholipase family protein [Bacteroidota bacterium]